MTAPAKLAAFAGALAVLFGGGALAGGAIDPQRDEDERPSHGMAEQEPHAAEAGEQAPHTPEAGEQEDAHAPEAGHGATRAAAVRGLGVEQDGLRLVVDDTTVRRGEGHTLRYRVVDDHGDTITDFDIEHERRMHLIVARRDLATFQHLHPRQAADGGWSVPLRLTEPGTYRVFADFVHEGTAYTLATDLTVDGTTTRRPLAKPSTLARSTGGHDVTLRAPAAEPGREATLPFTIRRGGRAVRTQPYLGAGGHLVALREGDLAFLHVHPTGDGTTFAATFPTAGRYRLFLQFKERDRVHTVAFTRTVR